MGGVADASHSIDPAFDLSNRLDCLSRCHTSHLAVGDGRDLCCRREYLLALGSRPDSWDVRITQYLR